MITTFVGTFCGHCERNVIPIAETALLYQIEQTSFVTGRPIWVRKHFDIVVGDDVGMCVDMRFGFGATRKTFQATSMLWRRTFGTRNKWLVQCASTHRTTNCICIVFYWCRRCTNFTNANCLDKRRGGMCGVYTKIQKKHLYTIWPEELLSCVMGDGLWACKRAPKLSKMENVGKCFLPFGNCKSAASSSTISTGACDITNRLFRSPETYEWFIFLFSLVSFIRCESSELSRFCLQFVRWSARVWHLSLRMRQLNVPTFFITLGTYGRLFLLPFICSIAVVLSNDQAKKKIQTEHWLWIIFSRT